MTGYNHTLAGVALSTLLPPPLALPAAFMSHFVMDALPHFGRDPMFAPWTRGFKNLLAADGLICLAIIAWAISQGWQPAWFLAATAAMATLPDFLWLAKGRFGPLDGFLHFHGRIQSGERTDGWIFEFIFSMAVILYLAGLQ